MQFSGKQAYSASPSEAQIKAAYFLNFAKLTECPPCALGGATLPFQVCLASKGRNRRCPGSHGREIHPRPPLQTRTGVRPADMRDCQLALLQAGDEGRLPAVPDALGETPTLTAGDFDEFSRLGGMIELPLQDNHVVFDVHRDAAGRAELQFSAQLLRLARVVRQSHK